MIHHIGVSSRRVADGGHQRVGSRGEGTQTHPHAEIIYLPPGSIAPVAGLEPLDLSQSRFNKPLLFALAANFIAWIFIVVAIRALISVLF